MGRQAEYWGNLQKLTHNQDNPVKLCGTQSIVSGDSCYGEHILIRCTAGEWRHNFRFSEKGGTVDQKLEVEN